MAEGSTIPSWRPSRRRTKRRTLVLLTLSLLATILAPTSTASSSPDATPVETLHESLLLKPLPDGRLLSTFTFALHTTSSSISSFRLLPRALLAPIAHYGASEVHLALNSGRWRYDSWGSPLTILSSRRTYLDPRSPLRLGEESVGVGAELRATFDNSTSGWSGLTSALAGLFCTSLDALDEKHTVAPHHTGPSTLHAMLPGENVCTENLTPFLKLLPCKQSAGLATLLNPTKLFGAAFHGLAVHVEQKDGWKVELTFSAVFQPAVTRDVSKRDWSMSSVFGRSLESTCPLAETSIVRLLKPVDGARFDVEPLPGFSVCARPGGECAEAKLFPVLDEVDEVTDELAASRLLAFETEAEGEAYEARLRERWAHQLRVDGEYLYNLPSALAEGSLDVAMRWPHEVRFIYPRNITSTALGVERTLLGSGQERTTLQVVFTNNDVVPQRILWFETLGYFVKPYLHTLSPTVTFLPDPPSGLLRSEADVGDPVEEVLYQPTRGARVSRKPFVLETTLRLPARSRVVVTLELRKVFVEYSRHPPDAHRGFDLNGAVVVPLAPVDPREEVVAKERAKQRRRTGTNRIAPATRMGWKEQLLHFLQQQRQQQEEVPEERRWVVSKSQSRIYTLPRLVELATPDFSFVYTNIIFTSTVIALFFGSTLNTLLRTFTDFVL
ncbi:GPI transamidase component PIG-T [Kalmanozyma brasiliensis GHG001]|uniref:Uncharacterized protein n=1 Tax=Kalmanozyma brasiliensis (strain GHG001) TaxID=1365824 RepID=V5E5G5_KALBG|nr:GPI transamidase component PIG-T [Kalmanozyma brasiliensis GHG001]EST05456.1 GPI transamidase component PIG-T [Kalmanozyma brasiliensis GHG001]